LQRDLLKKVVLFIAVEGVGSNDFEDDPPKIVDPRLKKFFSIGVLYRFRFLSLLYVTRNEDSLHKIFPRAVAGQPLSGE